MSSKYQDWTLVRIKDDLRRRGAKTTGRKAECIERLEAYDRNQNFSTDRPEEEKPICTMVLPQKDLYRDLNTTAELPKVIEAAANLYLLPFNKEMGSQNKLWKAKFLRYIRWAKQDEKVFFHGNCRAEMKKNVTYDTDIMIDSCGNVRQAQCECAAGEGLYAHCKHIICLLFSLVKFFSDGHLNTELTCTEKLQTFHRVKPYHGSPIKISDLNFGKPKQELENLKFDPRPPAFRNQKGYTDFVKNSAINFSSAAPNMTILQLVEPANPFAIINDHTYSSVSRPDHLLETLQVSKITQTECDILESDTRGQVTNPKWKKERLHRLHSSNFGRICKATGRSDMDAVAQSYMLDKKLNVAAVRHGRTYESVAIKQYETVTGNQVIPCGIFVRPQHPYVASSPDGIINETVCLEVKCPYTARDQVIGPDTVPYLELNNGTLDLCRSHDYYYQIQGQLYCSNRTLCHLVIFTKKDFQIVHLDRDDAFIAKMLEKLKNFYECHFKPALLNKYIYRDYYKYSFGMTKSE